MKKPFYQLEQSRDVIRHFTPNWFTATMGTGVVAMILAQLPFASSVLFMLATKLWQFNILLFITFSILYGLRWILFPTEAKQIFNHPNMSLFLGAIPMGLATIANGFLSFGVHLYGDIAVQIATYLWYLDVFFAVLIAWVVPFCMFSCQDHITITAFGRGSACFSDLDHGVCAVGDFCIACFCNLNHFNVTSGFASVA